MSSSPLPSGLALFAANVSSSHRRRRIVFCCVLIMAWLALTWPVFSFIEPVFPLVLGLPLALGWIVLWLTITFVGLLWLFVGDRREELARDRQQARSPTEASSEERPD